MRMTNPQKRRGGASKTTASATAALGVHSDLSTAGFPLSIHPMPRITRRQALTTLGALSLPLERLVAQPPPPAVSTASLPPASGVNPNAVLAALPADLPNFEPMLEWLAR